MKVKNIILSFALALPVLAFTSCQTDEDEVFDESSSSRLQQNLDEVKSVLRSAPYGWSFDYYYGNNQAHGGIVMTVKFDSLTCTAASELIPEETTSYYKMTTDQGPVLTFDTYNEVLHSLATPGSGNYEGQNADFEFVVQSATPELVVLKGKRIGNYAYLHPLDKPMLEYLDDVELMEDSIYVATAVGAVGADSVQAAFDYNTKIVTFSYSADTTFSEQRRFVYTDEGLRLYTPVTFAGRSVSEFKYEANNYLFTSVDAAASGFSMNGKMPADYLDYEELLGTYWLHFQRNENDIYVDDSAQVTIEQDVYERSFIMSGVNDNYTIALGYDRGRGCLTWNSQKVCNDDDGNEVWVVATSLAAGGNLLLSTTETGMLTTWNGDRENIELTWTTNEYFSDVYNMNFITDTWCLWRLEPGAAGSLGQILSGPYLFFGRQMVLNYVTSMVKIN